MYAQTRCSTVEAEKMRREKYKSLPDQAEFEDWMAQKIRDRRNKLVPFGTREAGVPDKIAVVVHVIHKGEAYGMGTNITDEQIISQIDVLNEDYQRKNADTLNTQPEFLNVAAKVNIEFVLARQDENKQPTNGIVRVQGPKDTYDISISDRELLSGTSNWDPNIYLNIWVTDLRSPYIGLAQFPDFGKTDNPENGLDGLDEEDNTDNVATDGLVIDYQAFGSVDKVPSLDLQSSYNLGRTTTHEIGHFLGLKHVWGDGGCSVDDFVTDTPNSDNDYSGLCEPSDHISCSSNDMFENFLYYTNDACMNIFSFGQVERMATILEFAPRRASLVNSFGTEYTDNIFFDLAINSIKSPGKVSCDNEIDPVIEIKNIGTIPATDFMINYTINNQEFTLIYDVDTIFSGETKEIQLEPATLSAGNYRLVVNLNNLPNDVDNKNNSAVHAFAVDNQKDFIPLREQLDIDDLNSTNWIMINDDGDIGWELKDAALVSPNNRAAYINLYNYEDRRQTDWLISPALDFSEVLEASVFFRASYAKNENFDDQLKILVSSDCGTNFNDIVGVFNSSDLSIESSQEFWEPENQTEWDSHSVDLSKYAGQENVRIAFQVSNDFGNNLYIDDIEFYATAEDKVVKTAQNSFTLYPNPTSDGLFKLSFNTSERQDIAVYIYDQMGKLLTLDEYPNTLNQTYYYDLTGTRSGIYFINVQGQDFVRSKKLLISR